MERSENRYLGLDPFIGSQPGRSGYCGLDGMRAGTGVSPAGIRHDGSYNSRAAVGRGRRGEVAADCSIASIVERSMTMGL